MCVALTGCAVNVTTQTGKGEGKRCKFLIYNNQ